MRSAAFAFFLTLGVPALLVAEPNVLVATWDDAITPVTGEYLNEAMTRAVRDSADEGTCWMASDGQVLMGVAAWQAPGRYPWSLGRNLRAIPSFLSVLRHAPGSLRDLVRFGSSIDAHFPREKPLWYLQVIGVSPEAQGLGVGKRLLAPAMDLADREQVPCYLETSNPDAVPFYLGAGFEIDAKGVELMAGGPTYWLMTRPPQ